MANSVWCVRPETTAPIDLEWTNPDTGDAHKFWVRLKKRLTIGEQRRVMTAGWTGVRPAKGAEIGIDFNQQAFERLLTWLVEWSLEDDQRARLPVTRDVVEALNPAVFELIEKAINDHVKSLDVEKNDQSGVGKPQATSA